MPLRIAIVGGGIGGLTLAVALRYLKLESLIEVDIYESAPELTQIGAGITFWPRAWKILEKLGLEEALASHLTPGQHIPDGKPRLAFQFRKADQKSGVPIRDLVIAGAALSFHRAVVQEVLLQHLSPSIRCHLSSRLISYRTPTYLESDKQATIELEFSNGKTAACDLLVGADGLKSVVRRQFLAENPVKSTVLQEGGGIVRSNNGEPVWSGTFAYRCIVDSSILATKMPGHRALTTPVIYCGKNKHLVAYPILHGRIVNIAAYVSDTCLEGTIYDGPSFQDVARDEVIPIFDEWEEEVRVLVHNAEKPSRWAIHAIKPLDQYAAGSVILLGDAAHAMTPHQGNGAGQAIEDAYILAHLILRTLQDDRKSIADLVRAYNLTRQPTANFVHEASRKHGLLYEFNSENFRDVKEEGDDSVTEERLKELGALIVEDWEYAWMSTADTDLDLALSRF